MGRRKSQIVRFLGVIGLSLLVASFAYFLPRFSPKLFAFEHKYSDWRTAFLSPQKASQDDRILIVKITEEDLAKLKYRSPIDRDFLADLIQRIDKNSPTVMGVDFLFDQATEPDKDERLIEVLSKAKSPIILAAVNDRYPSTRDQRSYMKAVETRTGLQTGLINLVSDIDGVIRRLPVGSLGKSKDTLSGRLATAFGARFDPDIAYWEQISWLRKTEDQTDIFLQTSAGFYIDNPDIAKSWTKDKIVILGAELLDSDHHRTPFTILGRQMKLTSGVQIHAQLIAQRLDGRRVILLPRLFEFLAYFIAALSAMELYRRYNKVPRLAKVTGYLGISLILLDSLFFKFLSVILPTAMIVMCFSTVITLCFFIRKLAKSEARKVDLGQL